MNLRYQMQESDLARSRLWDTLLGGQIHIVNILKSELLKIKQRLTLKLIIKYI